MIINTAVNVFEKKTKLGTQANNFTSKNFHNSKKISNGFHETTKKFNNTTHDNKPKISNSLSSESVAIGENKICVNKQIKSNITKNGLTKDVKELNGVRNKITQIYKQSNGILKNLETSSKGVNGEVNGTSTCGELKTEATRQGILKKSSYPKINQNRRSSVGFKEEDPIVIGFGGRDFCPEELEWEMASSDGEAGSASLDETEDDKVFSKLTQENTEFNADTTNLINENLSTKIGSDEFNRKNTKVESGFNAKICDTDQNTSVEENPNIVMKSNVVNNNIVHSDKNEENTENNNCKSEDVKSPKEIGDKKKPPSDKKVSFLLKNSDEHENSDEIKLKVRIKEDQPHNGHVDAQSVTADNAFTESTCTDHVTHDENNAVVPNGASIATEYEPTVDKNSFFPTSLEESCKSFKSVDDEFLVPSDDCSGNMNTETVHEAFNPALVSLQSMENGQHETNDLKDNFHIDEKKNDEPIDPRGSIDSRVDDEHNDKAEYEGVLDSPKTNDVIEKNDMQPRTSFLHGSQNKDDEINANLNAIYAPGADFFVSRRNSTSSISSSSSDDQKPTIVTITDNGVNKLDISDDSQEIECPQETQIKFEINDIKNNENQCSKVIISANLNNKPEIPIKPRKPPVRSEHVRNGIGQYAKPLQKPVLLTQADDIKDVYYSISNGSFGDNKRENHYAEANIYQEINNKVLSIIEPDCKDGVLRESRLAALALELEQARHSNNNSKRQAPCPPKVPEPPQEEPPSSFDRCVSPNDSQYKNEPSFMSSASSTTSSSSQDDTGFGSWHSREDSSKSSKWKNSFLLTQYSKCKMLAMGYGDDKSRSKKKFSLKKLLKLGKDGESTMNNENICVGRKAWKYSDNYDRPRAKLDIIHPMDLETKSLTINPGFDPSRSSTSSFTSGVEVISIRNSTSSDYGTYYSDTINPQETIGEKIHTSSVTISGGMNPSVSNRHPSGSTSPTPSRCSAYSQASTLTSGSSKNGCGPMVNGRPPKPPPPPRAHSLLPNIKNDKDNCCSYKLSSDDQSSSGGSVFAEENDTMFPQAPKRNYRSPKSDYVNFDTKSCSSLDLVDQNDDVEPMGLSLNGDECAYEYVGGMGDSLSEQYEDVSVISRRVQDRTSAVKIEKPVNGHKPPLPLTKSRSGPLNKAPSRPPPIYTKVPIGGIVRDNAWKTLEASYTVLANNNRETLIKLVEQAIKRRPSWTAANSENIQWENFQFDDVTSRKFFSSGDQVVYDATTTEDFPITLLISLLSDEQQDFRLSTNIKYPIFSHFYTNVPSRLLLEDNRTNMHEIQASVYVLNRSHVIDLETYVHNLPDIFSEATEREIAFILLQIIQELKGFQVQGIEELEPNCRSLLLAKTPDDTFHSLMFICNDYLEESSNAFSLALDDDCKVSLCQYALEVILHLFKVETIDELSTIGVLKFSSSRTLKIFENIANLLAEEKAVSLSQVKTLLECFLWDVQALVNKQGFDISESDVILHRWIDIERSSLIKNLVNNRSSYITNETEMHSQFLVRSSVRNIKDVLCYL